MDHGTWTVLQSLYPSANIPVYTLSLNTNFTYKDHYEFAKKLNVLRDQGVLIIGSGNIVHNTTKLNFDNTIHSWAEQFDEYVKNAVINKEDDKLINRNQAPGNSYTQAQLASRDEHYLPLLYILGVRNVDDKIKFFAESIDLGSISMRSVIYY